MYGVKSFEDCGFESFGVDPLEALSRMDDDGRGKDLIIKCGIESCGNKSYERLKEEPESYERLKETEESDKRVKKGDGIGFKSYDDESFGAESYERLKEVVERVNDSAEWKLKSLDLLTRGC